MKTLKIRRDKLELELKNAQEEQRDAYNKVADLQTKFNKTCEQIRKLSESNNDIVISEHAYLRYFTRVLGYDLDEIRQKMISPKIETAINTLKTGTFPGEGFKLKVKNKTVTTVLTDGED